MIFSKRGIIAALFLSTLALGGTRALACPPTLIPASGGSAIPATSVGGTWTTLTGPVLTEGIAGEVGTGTIILKAPAGFTFNTGATVTVKVSGSSSASKNLNNLANGSKITAAVTATAISITINARSTGYSNSLTWQNI
ncbi:MAG TPA: hypothetical protein VHI52_13270, partial [Verrucomicrobiae bacterium]|nr:hypothetical protein [Verrucomicrobiae bacterium]